MIYRPHLGYQGFERTMQKQLFVRSGSRYRPAKGVEILDAAAYTEAAKIEIEGVYLGGPQDAAEFFVRQMRHLPYEVMTAIFMTPQNRVIGAGRVFRGSIDSSPVFVREVAREALSREAAAVVVGHNHPSGIARPSDADLRTTRIMVAALALLEIQMLDHVIVGREGTYSFAMHGKIV